MKVKPLGDRVLIEALEAEEKTTGGIVIPDSAKEKQQRGKVVAVGKGRASDAGKISRKDAAGCILYAAEKATQMALEAIQCLGGSGYINDPGNFSCLNLAYRTIGREDTHRNPK